jgi:chromosome segregation ATPase
MTEATLSKKDQDIIKLITSDDQQTRLALQAMPLEIREQYQTQRQHYHGILDCCEKLKQAPSDDELEKQEQEASEQQQQAERELYEAQRRLEQATARVNQVQNERHQKQKLAKDVNFYINSSHLCELLRHATVKVRREAGLIEANDAG